ncbi:polysaccharide deacetylase [Streptomyces agglomeratus]|uniref:Polysaccharide deacetylase n=1 Tax=Streptomyces agglomeratus TaxID=285458 RepID=A0A1E5P4N9_9ACTN|nr:polysaccharide deacetylase family protein [Streptomyces agglomeratus]OEJ24503.1 polysaccharide deacetylase [Streptomyces agglomeratus]OEJ41545.1 polysaccharide deacetylase [Streptomyces agglomeratus]OEJ44076.1 polysaccharide deacetylase [Streptomyces agglomeratus]OEJ54035.1 polysaccharide deacetylase [Streptomyces agglomeratus]OEJ61408.1 polysaccharide deacetylase [Streptomyces agglomeratus]
MATVAVLGAALAGCGSGGGDPQGSLAAPPPTSASASGSASVAPSGRAAPPTLAAGPGGLTPVFERAPDTRTKTVALTFDADMTADQGPRAARGEHFDNPALIASLRRLRVPATVFMTGRWAEEYPDQARSIGRDPLFEIANHSYSHHAFATPCYGLPTVSGQRMRADVERAFAAFRKAGARNVVPYFRFPGGCYDDEALRAIAPAKVTAVQWDVVSGDAFARDGDAVAEQVLAGVRPGSLVVMHCTRSAAPVTAQAIARIVPELRERGYRFVKVSDLMKR